MSERVSPRGDAGEEGGGDDDAMAPVGDPDPQVSHPGHCVQLFTYERKGKLIHQIQPPSHHIRYSRN